MMDEITIRPARLGDARSIVNIGAGAGSYEPRDRDVVAAVSKAGGMGVLGAVAHSPEQLEIDLAWIENEVGGRPYGIDVIVPAKYAGSDEGGYTVDDIRKLIPAEHIAFVDDILTVTEAEIRAAMRTLLYSARLTPEPSGACSGAGLLFHRDQLLPFSKVVIVMSGGNVEPEVLKSVLAEEPQR